MGVVSQRMLANAVLVMTRGGTAAAQRAKAPLQRLIEHANAQRSAEADIGLRGEWQLFQVLCIMNMLAGVLRATACTQLRLEHAMLFLCASVRH